MKKPNSLRDFLIKAVPFFISNPDDLLIFVDDGTVRCTNAGGLSYEYVYNLNIIVTDYANEPEAIFLAVLGWMRIHQSDTLANLDKAREAIRFNVDVLDNCKYDLDLTLSLTERVVALRNSSGQYELTYPDEPQLTEANPSVAFQVQDNDGNIMAQWTTPDPDESVMLDVPNPAGPQGGECEC